jgi:hypothetical protein
MIMLDWNCKHEFLSHITEQITTYTYYTSCHQVYDVAKAIIQKFPYLCEKIGSGYDGWNRYEKFSEHIVNIFGQVD